MIVVELAQSQRWEHLLRFMHTLTMSASQLAARWRVPQARDIESC